LTRNLFIIVIIPFLSYLFFNNKNKEVNTKTLPKWYTFIPLFVIGFLLFSLIRTLEVITLTNVGQAFGIFIHNVCYIIYAGVSSFGITYLLGMAMAGVGLSTDFKMFKGIGITPFYIGFIAAVSVGIVSVTLVSLFGHFVVI